jgi:hypothetical protein
VKAVATSSAHNGSTTVYFTYQNNTDLLSASNSTGPDEFGTLTLQYNGLDEMTSAMLVVDAANNETATELVTGEYSTSGFPRLLNKLVFNITRSGSSLLKKRPSRLIREHLANLASETGYYSFQYTDKKLPLQASSVEISFPGVDMQFTYKYQTLDNGLISEIAVDAAKSPPADLAYFYDSSYDVLDLACVTKTGQSRASPRKYSQADPQCESGDSIGTWEYDDMGRVLSEAVNGETLFQFTYSETANEVLTAVVGTDTWQFFY